LLSPRKAAVLAMQLPPGAQVWVSAGMDSAWTPGDHLAAHTVDVLQAANWQRSGGKGDKPKPIQRPGDSSRVEMKKVRQQARAREFKARTEGT